MLNVSLELPNAFERNYNVSPTNAGDTVVMTGVQPDDPDPIPVGTKGTGRFVSDLGDWGQIDVEWENGRSLMLLDTDPYRVL